MANKLQTNPYQRLLWIAKRYINSIRQRPKIEMTFLVKERVINRNVWRFDDVANYVQAAEQLGYECLVEWDANVGLRFWYRRLPADPPYPLN